MNIMGKTIISLISLIPLLKNRAFETPCSTKTAGLFENMNLKALGIVSIGFMSGENIMNINEMETADKITVSLVLNK